MLLILSLFAAGFTTLSFIPQAFQIIKTKNTSGISLGMYMMFTFGVLLWLIYGFYIHDLAVTLANGITLIFAITILTYKINNYKKDKIK